MPSYRNGKKKDDNGMIWHPVRRLFFYGNDGATVHTATAWEDGTASCNQSKCCMKTAKTGKPCEHCLEIQAADGDINYTDQVMMGIPALANVISAKGRSRTVDAD